MKQKKQHWGNTVDQKLLRAQILNLLELNINHIQNKF